MCTLEKKKKAMVMFAYFLVLKLKLQYAALMAALMTRGG